MDRAAAPAIGLRSTGGVVVMVVADAGGFDERDDTCAAL